jgi:hypothetical protein
MDAAAVPTASVVPDNISASGARRLAAAAAAAKEPGAAGHAPFPPTGHAKAVSGAEAEDPLDGAVEAALRKATGEEHVRHERLDHARHRDAKELDVVASQKHLAQPRRRPGFGSTGARAARRAAQGRAGTASQKERIAARACVRVRAGVAAQHRALAAASHARR